MLGVSTADFTILGLAGSLRQGSYNRLLLRHTAEAAPAGVSFDHFDGLGALPHFDQDLEDGPLPAAVADLNDRIGRADALLVATPEYNGAAPGVLKNALDWASRPAGESVLAGLPAAVMGASPGRFGAVRAQQQVRAVLTAIGADVLDQELPVAKVHEVLDAEGRLTDPDTAAALSHLVAALVAHAGGPAPAAVARSASYSRACQLRRAG